MEKRKTKRLPKRLSNEVIVLIVLTGILCIGAGVGAVRHFKKGNIELAPLAQAPLAIDINQAVAEELIRLPGIGPELAERIVLYRNEHGAFLHPDSLLAVSGIGEGKLAEIKPYIEVR